MKNEEEGPWELMESLEQVHQFSRGISPKEGLSSLPSSCGCSKGYGSTEQSLWSLIADTNRSSVTAGQEISPACCSQRNGGALRGTGGVLQVPGTTATPPTLHNAGSRPQGPRGCAARAGQGHSATSSQLPPAAPELAPRCHPGVKPKRAPGKGGQL